MSGTKVEEKMEDSSYSQKYDEGGLADGKIAEAAVEGSVAESLVWAEISKDQVDILRGITRSPAEPSTDAGESNESEGKIAVDESKEAESSASDEIDADERAPDAEAKNSEIDCAVDTEQNSGEQEEQAVQSLVVEEEEEAKEEIVTVEPLSALEQAAVIKSFFPAVGDEGGEVNDERANIIVEYLTGIVLLADQNNMSPEQLSVLYSLGWRLFEKSRNRGSDQWLALPASFSLFKEMLVAHSSGEGKMFDRKQRELVVTFFASTFFRHYSAYELVFTTSREPLPIVKNVVIDTALPFPSLSEAREVEEEKPAPQPASPGAATNTSENTEAEAAVVEDSATDMQQASATGASDEDAEDEDALSDRLEAIVKERVEKRRAEMEQELEDMKLALEDADGM